MQLRAQKLLDKYAGGAAIAVLRPATILLGRILGRDHRLDIRGEVVWVKMLGGGSLILAMPMLLAFRRAHPNTRMVLVTTPAVKPFAELMGVFDEYRVIDNRSAAEMLATALGAWARTIRADTIVDLEVYSRLTTVFTTATLARNRVTFWLEDIFWRQGLASHLVFFNRGSGSYHFYDRIADLYGIPTASRTECRGALLRSCGVDESIAPRAGSVCVGVACSDLGQERMLTPSQWTRVFAENLRPEHDRFLFLGSAADRDRAESIIAVLRAEFPRLTFDNACGRLTLKESVAALFAAPEFWGIDSSLLHLARIAGARCLSYWGPTDPATRLRDWGVEERVVYRKIACSPCVHVTEEPPCRGDNRCIQGIFDPSVAPVDWTPMTLPRSHAPRG